MNRKLEAINARSTAQRPVLNAHGSRFSPIEGFLFQNSDFPRVIGPATAGPGPSAPAPDAPALSAAPGAEPE